MKRVVVWSRFTPNPFKNSGNFDEGYGCVTILPVRRYFPELNLSNQARLTFIFVVVVGYVVGAFSAWHGGLQPFPFIISLALTAVYLFLGLREGNYFARFPGRLGTAVYFIIQLALVLTVQFILGPGGSWLISLPIAGMAVERLSPLWRWPVYLTILAGIALPLAQATSPQEAFFFTLTFSPAILFVVVFSKMLLSEQEAREKAEKLAGQLEEATASWLLMPPRPKNWPRSGNATGWRAKSTIIWAIT